MLKAYYKGIDSKPYSYCTSFKKYKSKNSYRVFMIGESSLSGWPYSTDQSIQKKIEYIANDHQTGKNIELITVSIAGFNSSILLDLISQIIKYEPDMIIIYSGHNEFYGYNGYTGQNRKSQFAIIETAENIMLNNGLLKMIKYDNYFDDLEFVIPFCSKDPIIELNQKIYDKIKEQYFSNMLEIIELCKENKTKIILSILPDNYLLQPVGVTNQNHNTSADIVYNNARMALMRDGDQGMALKLFQKAKDLDALRLRIPEEFSEGIKKIAIKRKIELADIKSIYISRSKSTIPDNDLFADYIHPNINGLNIIAEVYAKIIIAAQQTRMLGENNGSNRIRPIVDSMSIAKNDLLIAKKRTEKSSAKLKRLNIVQLTKDNIQLMPE